MSTVLQANRTRPPDLDALSAVSDAAQTGAGLAELLRAASRALGVSLLLLDRSSSVLAVAARSPAEERALWRQSEGVSTVDLKLSEVIVGRLRVRERERPPDGTLLRIVATLIASAVERVRAPERVSEEAANSFQRAVLGGLISDREDLLARGAELGIELGAGASVIVVRAHTRTAAEHGWHERMLAIVRRVARPLSPGSIAVPSEHAPREIVVLTSDRDGQTGARVSSAVRRELALALGGFAFTCGVSRRTLDPLGLRGAFHEALLAANVLDGDPERGELPFTELGTYQLLVAHMDEPAELERFYEQTVRPLVDYDERYTAELLHTLSTFLDCDGNVNATATALIAHRHTVRYRFERVRELTGLDVASTNGRETLGLGLKAMRALGIVPRRGPGAEARTVS